MGWFDAVTSPVTDVWHSVVDSNPVTSTISEAVHNAGESTGINDFADKYSPAIAAAVAIYLTGGALGGEELASLESAASDAGMTLDDFAALHADSVIQGQVPIDIPSTPVTDFSPDVPISSASPELDPTGSMATSPLNDAYPTYDYSPNTPVSNAPPELDPTGSMADMANPTMSPTNIARALRLANTAKNLLGSRNAAQQQMQQSFNFLNGQKLAQGLTQGTGLPAEYRAKNPFDFGQQQPIQDQLASLLRNNYGN